MFETKSSYIMYVNKARPITTRHMYPPCLGLFLLAPKDFEIICLSNLATMTVHLEDYSKNTSCALKYISTFSSFLFTQFIFSVLGRVDGFPK